MPPTQAGTIYVTTFTWHQLRDTNYVPPTQTGTTYVGTRKYKIQKTQDILVAYVIFATWSDLPINNTVTIWRLVKIKKKKARKKQKQNKRKTSKQTKPAKERFLI